MGQTLIVVSKIKKMVKVKGFRTGKDYLDALSSKVDELISASVQKVQDEGKRKTLGAEDI